MRISDWSSDVCSSDLVPGGIVFQACMRGGAAAAALVEQQDLIAFGVEQPPVCRRATAARTAMQKYGRLALRIAAKLPIHLVTVSGIQETMGIRLYFRKIGRATCRERVCQ